MSDTFEPFQRVLVRDFDTQNWKADLFSHVAIEYDTTFFACMGEAVWLQCIPYTDETAHLLGTTQPYDTPKPPQVYEWGQKVEACAFIGEWGTAIYIGRAQNNEVLAVLEDDRIIRQFSEDKIRPLPDTAAHLDAKP